METAAIKPPSPAIRSFVVLALLLASSNAMACDLSLVAPARSALKNPVQVTASVENDVLTVKGTRRFESKEDEQVMLGRAYGAFKRAFTLPDYVDDANLDAHLADGVLTIRIPKHAQAKPRKIQIGTGSRSKQLKE